MKSESCLLLGLRNLSEPPLCHTACCLDSDGATRMVEAGLLPSGSSRARNTNTEKPPPPLPLPIRIPESRCTGHCLGSFASGWEHHALKGSLPGSPLILPAPALRLGTCPSCPVCSHHRMSLSWLGRKAQPAPLGSSLLLSFIFTNPWASHLGFSTGFMLREQERSPS